MGLFSKKKPIEANVEPPVEDTAPHTGVYTYMVTKYGDEIIPYVSYTAARAAEDSRRTKRDKENALYEKNADAVFTKLPVIIEKIKGIANDAGGSVMFPSDIYFDGNDDVLRLVAKELELLGYHATWAVEAMFRASKGQLPMPNVRTEAILCLRVSW